MCLFLFLGRASRISDEDDGDDESILRKSAIVLFSHFCLFDMRLELKEHGMLAFEARGLQ